MTAYSDADFTNWLADNQHTTPVVLVVAEHSAGSVYLSTRGYVSLDTDSDPNRYFEDLLNGNIVIDERMDSVSVGSISILNDGGHTDWLGFVWLGYSIKIYLGDARWRFSNFRLMASVYNGGFHAPSSNKYQFKVLDLGLALEEEVGSDIAPLIFGRVINVPAVLIDFGTLRYKVLDGAATNIGVRDNGIDITPAQIDEVIGEFTLSSAPAGRVTATVRTKREEPTDILLDLVSFTASRSGDQLFDIDDAALPAPDNINSSEFVANNNVVLTFPTVDGDYVVNMESNSVPTNRANAQLVFGDIVTAGLVDGTTYRVSGQARHVGSGGKWQMALGNSTWPDVEGNQQFLNVDTIDTTWIDFSIGFIHGTGDYRVDRLICDELGGTDDGGLEVRNLDLYSSALQLNADSFDAFDNTTGDLGIFVGEPTKIREVFDKVMGSVGGFYGVNALGELQIFKLDVPATSTFDLTADDIEQHGITHISTEPPVDIMHLRYAHNDAVQSADGLAGAVTADDRELYSREWREVSDENALSDYPLINNVTRDTYIYVDWQAQDEVERRQVIRATKREIFKVKSFLAAGQVSLGDTITITYPQYGFESGKDMVVIGRRRELGKRNITLTVWG